MTMTSAKESGGAGTTDAGQHRPAPNPDVVMPPAPPGESSPQAVAKTKAVADALSQLGQEADPRKVREHIKATVGLDIEPDEVVAIRSELLRRAATPPGPDQPPPQEARRKTAPEGGPSPEARAATITTAQETG
jgi:hypothetical protein